MAARARFPNARAHRRDRMGRPRRRRARRAAELTDMATEAFASPLPDRQDIDNGAVLERHRPGRAAGQALRRLLASSLAAAARLPLLRLGQARVGRGRPAAARSSRGRSFTAARRRASRPKRPTRSCWSSSTDAKGVRMIGNLVNCSPGQAQGRPCDGGGVHAVGRRLGEAGQLAADRRQLGEGRGVAAHASCRSRSTSAGLSTLPSPLLGSSSRKKTPLGIL